MDGSRPRSFLPLRVLRALLRGAILLRSLPVRGIFPREMADLWTEDRVTALAPDSSSADAGRGLATTRKWVTLGCSDRAIWGECQGSGKNPYQVRVDLSEPAFKCSCPSRKFPCKHSLGLMYLLARDASALTESPEPQWVAEWLDARGARAAKKAEKAATGAEKTPDPVAQARRAAKREQAVAAGLDEFEIWLRDLVRAGLATAQARPMKFWETAAARLVDAQAPGLAALVRELPDIIASGEGWQRRAVDHIGRITLILRAARRLDQLPEDLRTETRTAIGWTIAKDDVLATPPVADRWLVLGRCVEQDDRLKVQRTWLWGVASARPALILDFAAGNAPLDASLSVGAVLDADLCFYPGSLALRALVKDRRGVSAPTGPLPGFPTLAPALTCFAQYLARCPWLPRLALPLTSVLPVRRGSAAMLADSTGRALPISRRFSRFWHMLALSGGHPLNVAGEWDGDTFLPLSIWTPGAGGCKDVGLRIA